MREIFELNKHVVSGPEKDIAWLPHAKGLDVCLLGCVRSKDKRETEEEKKTDKIISFLP